MTDCQHRLEDSGSPALLLDNQVCFPLYSAANAVIRAYRPVLDEIGLTYPQYLVMMVLWQHDGINVKDLGAKLNLDSGTLTPLLKRLETKGLIHRRRSQTDERVRELHLSERGAELKQKAENVPKAMRCKIDLELDDLLTLKQLCEKVMAKLG